MATVNDGPTCKVAKIARRLSPAFLIRRRNLTLTKVCVNRILQAGIVDGTSTRLCTYFVSVMEITLPMIGTASSDTSFPKRISTLS